jgi:putative ABC transport system ATP-binding protein
MHVEVRHGRIDGLVRSDLPEQEDSASDDLRRKLRLLSATELFANLDNRSRRLLAFSAQWYEAEEGQRIFAAGDRADAVYLCLSGRAELALLDDRGGRRHISEVAPGRLIGDLSIILNEPRQLDLIALEDTQFLRIGAEQFRLVMENDTAVLLSLLRTVGGHLSGAADILLAAGMEVPREQGPQSPLEAERRAGGERQA